MIALFFCVLVLQQMLLAAGDSPGQEPDPATAKEHVTNGSSQHDLGRRILICRKYGAIDWRTAITSQIIMN